MPFSVVNPMRGVMLATLLPFLGGCYLMQAAAGQMAVMAERQPVAEIVRNPKTPPQLRTRLVELGAARDFASGALALPDNESYRLYADIGRNYVVWNVFATPPFSVEARRWCFPVAGCVVYRGYFSEHRAQAYAGRLRRKGDDVAVGGVTAYSTLGHFADPILSSMLPYSDAQLAGTVFHELAHQLIYFKDDSAFNEAFASTVEEVGVVRWLARSGRQADLDAWQRQKQRGEDFSRLLLGAREQLRGLYAEPLQPAEMNHRKQQILGRLKFSYEQQRSEWGGYAGYDAWFARTLTNADLVATATYRRCIPGFKRMLAASGDDLGEFYQRVRKLASETPAARQQLLCAGPD
ncbi:MAG: aminopeptidase [Steroidobacteraceae bacterium]